MKPESHIKHKKKEKEKAQMYPSSSSSTSSGSLFNTRRREFKDFPELWDSDTDSQKSLGWYPTRSDIREPAPYHIDPVSYWIKKWARQDRKSIEIKDYHLKHLFAEEKNYNTYSLKGLFTQNPQIKDAKTKEKSKEAHIQQIVGELESIQRSMNKIYELLNLM